VGDQEWGAHRSGGVRLADPTVRRPGRGVRVRARSGCCSRGRGGFDLRGVELSHVGDDCSFETILRRHELNDPVLWRLGNAVHEADLDDGRYDAPEAAGLDMILRGRSMTGDDEATRSASAPVFDALYEFHRRALLLGASRPDPRH
jgi:hypothetical protein